MSSKNKFILEEEKMIKIRAISKKNIGEICEQIPGYERYYFRGVPVFVNGKYVIMNDDKKIPVVALTEEEVVSLIINDIKEYLKKGGKYENSNIPLDTFELIAAIKSTPSSTYSAKWDTTIELYRLYMETKQHIIMDVMGSIPGVFNILEKANFVTEFTIALSHTPRVDFEEKVLEKLYTMKGLNLM